MKLDYDKVVEILRESNPLVDVRMESEEYKYSVKIINLRHKLKLGEMQTAMICGVAFSDFISAEKGDPRISLEVYKKIYDRLEVIDMFREADNKGLEEIGTFKGTHQEVADHVINIITGIRVSGEHIYSVEIENIINVKVNIRKQDKGMGMYKDIGKDSRYFKERK